MEYPVVFRRKRVGPIVLNSLLLAFSLVMAVYGYIKCESVVFYLIASAVFLFSLGFNIFLSREKTVVIDKDGVSVVSLFLPKIVIRAEDLKGVEYSDETQQELKINYDLPEFNVRNILGDIDLSETATEGLWTYTLSAKDVDRPLAEVKMIIQDVILSRDV